MTILGEIAAAPLLRALSVPDEIFDMSVLYLRIFLLGMPVILLYNFESSISAVRAIRGRLCTAHHFRRS